MKVEPVFSSEMSVSFYRTTHCDPQDHNMNRHYRENFESHIVSALFTVFVP